MRMSALQTILVLNISSRLHTSANRLAGFAEAISAEFFVIYSGDFDVNIDAVKDGTGDALLVFGHHSRRTGTGLLTVPKVSARAGIHRGDQLEIS